MKRTLVLTCEHGGNRVPERYRKHFATAGRALAGHRGWDAGALVLARELARSLDAPLHACTTSRLVVDTNRSRGHRRLLSEWTRSLPSEERARILERWWLPHRSAVEERVRTHVERGRTVLHLSIHSFTPVWQGRRRRVDAGFLYDPSRASERSFASAWIESLRALRPELLLRRNQPYRGTEDGLTKSLRTLFDGESYLGLELEVSQRFPLGAAAPWRRLRRDLLDSLERTLGG